MSRSFLRRKHDSTRFAARKRFLAMVEQLEPRYVLTAPIQQVVTYWASGGVVTLCNYGCDCGCPPYSPSSFEAVAGDNRVEPEMAPNQEYAEYLPAYSTASLRDAIVAVNYQMPPFELFDSAELETTFNSTTGPTLYYDLTSLTYNDRFQFADTVDVSGLGPGQYPFTMDFVFTNGGGAEPDDYEGNVLVRSDSNALLSEGWSIPALDKLTVSGAGALWEPGSGDLFWFEEDTGNYITPPQELDGNVLEDIGGGEYTLTNRWGDVMTFVPLAITLSA